jgi:hypothetical protein
MIKTRIRKPVGAARAKTLPTSRPFASPGPRGEVCLGWLVGWDDQGPLVDYDGNAHGPLHARVSGGAGLAVRQTMRTGTRREIVLLVDSRPGRSPVLLGLLQPIGPMPGAPDLEARVDGRRIEIVGQDEIVLRCGEASITLRRNGRILIRGIQVESRATGVNRIKGGSVAIN